FTILGLVIAIVLYVFYKYNFGMKPAFGPDNYPVYQLEKKKVSVSQVKSAKFFLIVVLMFFVQVMIGALLAHYYIEPDSFFGMDWIFDLLPFGVAKGYHLQLAIFWIATAWLGMGIYLAPDVRGLEPRRDVMLVDSLFSALVGIDPGSIADESLAINAYLTYVGIFFRHAV